jgi:hypothetical protein
MVGRPADRLLAGRDPAANPLTVGLAAGMVLVLWVNQQAHAALLR